MLKKSLFSIIAAGVALSAHSTQAEELTSSEREKLQKLLLKVIDKSESTLNKRQATAYKAYKSALSSNTAAFELYLDCIEKVNYEDAGKKASDFRDWKRKNKEKHSDPGFRLALRHQLNWLVLTIDASRIDEDNYPELSSRALDAFNKVLSDGKALEKHHNIVRQSAINSVFAQAYGFGNYDVKSWPKQPLALSAIYEKLVFPPLKKGKKASLLRSAWLKRIRAEETMLELWAPKPEGKAVGMKKALAPPELQVFATKERPKLLWKMELDVFEAGDQAGAASRMIELITKNYTHNDASKWAEELQNLISPKKEETEISEATKPKKTPVADDSLFDDE